LLPGPPPAKQKKQANYAQHEEQRDQFHRQGKKEHAGEGEQKRAKQSQQGATIACGGIAVLPTER
jgi:hypothetical protein